MRELTAVYYSISGSRHCASGPSESGRPLSSGPAFYIYQPPTYQVRAGATLLFDSRPEAEEAETELKASAMRDAVLRPEPPPAPTIARELTNSATAQACE